MLVFSVYNPKDPEEHIDLMIHHTEFHEQILRNRDIMDLSGVPVPIASIDDLIVLKTIAGREQDKQDIKALEKLREWKKEKNSPPKSSIDLDYLRTCYEMTPEQRYCYFGKIMEFFKIVAPTESKENWRKLKELGF